MKKMVFLSIVMLLIVKLAWPLGGGEALMLDVIFKLDSLAKQARTSDSLNWEIIKDTDGRYCIYDLGSPLVLSDNLISFPVVDYIDYYSPLVPLKSWKEIYRNKKKVNITYYQDPGFYFKRPGEESFLGIVERKKETQEVYIMIGHKVFFFSSTQEISTPNPVCALSLVFLIIGLVVAIISGKQRLLSFLRLQLIIIAFVFIGALIISNLFGGIVLTVAYILGMSPGMFALRIKKLYNERWR